MEFPCVIQSVHEKLRSDLGSCGSFKDVWQKHVSDLATRKGYSDAMRHLDERSWVPGDRGPSKECRVGWCAEFIPRFFETSLIDCVRKDLRMALSQSCTDEKYSVLSSEAEGILLSMKDVSSVEHISEDLSKKIEYFYGEAVVDIVKPSEPRKVLDVGSCNDPFSRYLDVVDFEVTAIDLTPACETVMEVDFVNLEPGESSGVGSRFGLQSFDVVTFCLLLSYLPCPRQRLQFCEKARALLKVNGLLLITETQSVTPRGNTMLMKQWKFEVENLGFRRIVYESKTHIHAMAFRKVPLFLKPEKSLNYAIRSSLPIKQDQRVDRKRATSDKDEFFIPKPQHKIMKSDAVGE